MSAGREGPEPFWCSKCVSNCNCKHPLPEQYHPDSWTFKIELMIHPVQANRTIAFCCSTRGTLSSSKNTTISEPIASLAVAATEHTLLLIFGRLERWNAHKQDTQLPRPSAQQTTSINLERLRRRQTNEASTFR
mmetsp:Transcript_29285/g.43173  ORF Transcript_29285/g.43173 Transcript_29285/m.43173 type:complete len:134 (+) Transcript_29285:265-666(+)